MGSILVRTLSRHPLLVDIEEEILSAFNIISTSYSDSGKLLICGNGGSAADAEHIVGELMKSFVLPRIVPANIKNKFIDTSSEIGPYLAEKLQPALRAIALTSHPSLNTAFANDVESDLVFAQQVLGYGDQGDVLLAISTSGNSKNVIHAAITAKALGLKVIGLSGFQGGRLRDFCDVCICVTGEDAAEIQELHLPIYHALCKMLEVRFFGAAE